ncbi:MAG: hypothetical protein JWN82_153 [Candidatus Saccharibacteria bacterium]|nr:hypothetical protein [Candidatus Saccharibacteria bacterium]
MAHELQLPLSVIGPADVVRLRRSLEQFNDQEQQAALRTKSGATADQGQAGRILHELATANKRDIGVATDRQALLTELEALLKTAPKITMSFAVEPSAAFMTKIVGWFRTSIHPMVLIRVGLQPNIAAGCTVQTGGKVYDFSLRSKFTEQRAMLIERLHTPRVVAPSAAPVTQEVAT